MGTPEQLCTLTDVFELGIGQNALRQSTAKHIRSVIRTKSSGVSAALRKRYLPPLARSLVEWDTAGLATGAAAWAGTPTTVADATIEVVTGGAAGPGATVKVALDQLPSTGAPDYGAAVALGTSGEISVAGVVVTFYGTLTTTNKITFRIEVEGCVREAVALLSAHVMLHNRGLDPKTMETLKQRRDEAMIELDAWADGERRELPPDADASPTVDEGGSLGDGDQDPWDWLDR